MTALIYDILILCNRYKHYQANIYVHLSSFPLHTPGKSLSGGGTGEQKVLFTYFFPLHLNKTSFLSSFLQKGGGSAKGNKKKNFLCARTFTRGRPGPPVAVMIFVRVPEQGMRSRFIFSFFFCFRVFVIFILILLLFYAEQLCTQLSHSQKHT